MAAIFFLLLLATIASLITGLVKPSLFSRFFGTGVGRKKISWVFGLATLISFFLIGLTTPKSSTNQRAVVPSSRQEPLGTNTLTTPTPTSIPTSALTATPTSSATAPTVNVLDQLWSALDKTVKTRKNISIRYVEGERAAYVDQRVEEFYTEVALVKDTFTDFVKYGNAAFQIPGVEFIGYKVIMPTVDLTNGQKQDSTAVYVGMEKAKFEAIQWKNLVYQPILAVFKANGEGTRINPILLKKIENTDDIHLKPIE